MPAVTVRRLVPLLMLSALVAAVAGVTAVRFGSWPSSLAPWLAGVAGIYAAWILWEGAISARDAREVVPASDRWTNELYGLAQGTTVLVTILWSNAVRSSALQVAGIAAFGLGLALRMAAIRALGAMYSHRARLRTDHELVTRGPYRHLRHPAYAGMLLAHLGLCGTFASWVGALSLALLLLPAIVWRIEIEERVMRGVTEYEDFCRGRARLVPGIW